MNRTTIIMVALALGSMGLAWSMRPVELPPVQFEDTGQPLFPDFTDPTTATGLAVVAWDEKEAKVVRFEVEHKASNFVLHRHDPAACDLVICWENDWPNAPIPIGIWVGPSRSARLYGLPAQLMAVADVTAMVERLFADRVRFHDGAGEIAPIPPVLGPWSPSSARL